MILTDVRSSFTGSPYSQLLPHVHLQRTRSSSNANPLEIPSPRQGVHRRFRNPRRRELFFTLNRRRCRPSASPRSFPSRYIRESLRTPRETRQSNRLGRTPEVSKPSFRYGGGVQNAPSARYDG